MQLKNARWMLKTARLGLIALAAMHAVGQARAGYPNNINDSLDEQFPLPVADRPGSNLT